jgi:hypothetical protein
MREDGEASPGSRGPRTGRTPRQELARVHSDRTLASRRDAALRMLMEAYRRDVGSAETSAP